ncbi:MAG: hypothetical protein JO262_07580 [Solirubrobacterales bacterium]|nr:hypothetical protein [Solirubrobacterales bacterium]
MAVVAVALITTPPAFADTFDTAANVNFNGVVDSRPNCTDASAITIQWGDGSTSAGRYLSNGSILGNHTYRAAGTLSGHIVFSGDSSCSTSETLTASVGATPEFTQCPQVGADVGCQFLIEIKAGGTATLQDSSQNPYENSDDALIGVENDSSSPVSSIPIAPSSPVFGFEADGLCDPGFGPVPTGCLQIGAAPGTPCDPSAGPCAFSPVPGQPGPNPAAYSGSTQNGYEGPLTYFTGVSAAAESGVVHFSPSLPPGQSTFLSLEEPPSANGLSVGWAPVDVGLSAPPSVTATSAAFVGGVNPNGAATVAHFQFNLDRRYGKLASVNQSTPPQSVGGDFADHVVTATVAGLAPNAIYHVRLVATNKNGQTAGNDVTFKTQSAAPPRRPRLGQTFTIVPVSGVVLAKVNGLFQPITQRRQFPKKTLFDALGGTFRLITASGGHAALDAAANGKKHGATKHKGKVKTQIGTFGGAVVTISQARSGLTALTLVENAFKGGPSFKKCKGKAADATAASPNKTLQLLHASAKGKFTSRGRYAAATVRATKWTIADRCDGTLVHDISDSVSVNDFVHHTTVILHAGQSYLARKP